MFFLLKYKMINKGSLYLKYSLIVDLQG